MPRKKQDDWIARAVDRLGSRGQLHRDLGIPEGQKIPKKALETAARRTDKVGQRARTAIEIEKKTGNF